MPNLFSRLFRNSTTTDSEPYDATIYSDVESAGDDGDGTLTGQRLLEARTAARERYRRIAEALKKEAGVLRHYTHKQISGLAWTGDRRILAPEGVTRRQLYVLAHECGHIVLHSAPATRSKPNHVLEHEAEVYAHRAFARYGLEVPPASAEWARNYVGRWIAKDRAAGIRICPDAAAFSLNVSSPQAPLAAVDGHPKTDFSKAIERHTNRGLRIAEKQDAITIEGYAESGAIPSQPPNACGTCEYVKTRTGGYDCAAYLRSIELARFDPRFCKDGEGWRPKGWRPNNGRRGFLARILGRPT